MTIKLVISTLALIFVTSNASVNAQTALPYSMASSILCGDFISPDEVELRSGVFYGDEERKSLASTLPAIEILKWCSDRDYVLLPGPPKPMNFLDVHNLNSSLFDSRFNWWQTQEFAEKDEVWPGWLLIRKNPVPQPEIFLNLKQQIRLLSEVERVPNAAELAWLLTTYRNVRGTRLLTRPWCAKTASHNSQDGWRVHICGLEEGLFTYCFNDRFGTGGLGIAAARK